MRTLRRYWLAAAVAAAAVGPAVGQTTGTGGSLGTATSGTTGTTGTGGTGATLGGNTGGAGGNTGQSSSQSTSAAPTLSTLTTTPPLLAPSKTQTSGTINQQISTSNYFGRYYGNPMYQGSSTVPLAQSAGGFGNVLYAVPGVTAVTSSSGAAGGRGGATSSFGTRGSTTVGAGGLNLQDPGGQIVGLPRQISYTSTVRFQAPLPPATQVAAELRGMIDRSTMIANPAGVQLMIDAPSGVVVLRGTVRDEDEARTVEGVVRLTPGVRGVKNELAFPRP